MLETSGQVEAFKDGNWAPTHPGETLDKEQVLRVAPGGGARIASAGMTFKLSSATELELQAPSPEHREASRANKSNEAPKGIQPQNIKSETGDGAPAARGLVDVAMDTSMVLRKGSLRVSVTTPKAHVQVNAQEASAAAQGPAEFAMRNPPEGPVSVVTQQGQVSFSNANQKSTVGPGQHSLAWRNQAPTQPATFPLDMLLSVNWPKK